MNFWRSFGFYTPSPVDNILEKDSFELEELLEEDDIIHELRVLNKNLLSYLVNPTVLEKVVRYVVTNGQVEVDGQPLPEAKQKKFVNVCTEILALDAFTIADAVCQNEHLIDNLYGFLEGTPPLKPHTASHGSRILTALLNQRPKTIVDFLQKKESAIPNLIRHIGSSPVMDLLLSIIRCDESARAAGVEGGTLRWLLDSNLLSSIVALLGPEHKESVQENAAEALLMILTISDTKSSLVLKIHSEEIVSELFRHTMADASVTSSSLRNGLTIISELIAHLSDVFAASDDEQQLPPVLASLETHLPALKGLLESRSGQSMPTSFGKVDSPFGPTRLKVLELFASVVKTKYEAFVYRIMIDQGVFVTCMNLFFTYEWNSILHKSFFDIVKSILEGGDLALKTALFEECDFHTQIAIHSMPTAGALRKGFMGYVYQIATSIEKDAEDVSAIAEKLETSAEWKQFVEAELIPTRRIIDPLSAPPANPAPPVPAATTTTTTAMEEEKAEAEAEAEVEAVAEAAAEAATEHSSTTTAAEAEPAAAVEAESQMDVVSTTEAEASNTNEASAAQVESEPATTATTMEQEHATEQPASHDDGGEQHE